MINFKDGGSAIITIFLIIIMISVASFGFLYLLDRQGAQVADVQNNSINLSGIDYHSEVYNGTNTTLHSLSGIMPNFIWILVIFLIVVILLLVAVVLKR
jgi:hypothetical protein